MYVHEKSRNVIEPFVTEDVSNHKRHLASGEKVQALVKLSVLCLKRFSGDRLPNLVEEALSAPLLYSKVRKCFPVLWGFGVFSAR